VDAQGFFIKEENMILLIVLGLTILIGTGLTIFMVCRNFTEEAPVGIGMFTGAFLIAWLIILGLYGGAQSQVTFWNDLHDTKYTAEQWFWNGSMIQSYDLKLKTNKTDIDLHIDK
jgi:hypothetical protein